MSQIDTVSLTTEWTAFTDITTPDSSTYYIQNRGSDYLLALESASEPSTTTDGVVVPPYKVLSYVAGTDTLYLRAYGSSCSINVTKAE